MKIEGSYEIEAGIETVWELLNNVESLAAAIPGVQSLTATGDNSYQASLSVGIGPVSGTYAGTVQLRDRDRPHSYTLVVEGKGLGGFVRGESRFRLSEIGSGRTRIDVEGDASVGGVLARVGQRLVASVAKAQMDRFFESLSRQASAAQ